MYGIGGEKELPESTLDHLSGYGGAQPVRIGNGAATQRQNDVYGALLDSIYIHSRALDGVSDELCELASSQVEAAIAIWRERDQGIWEARGGPTSLGLLEADVLGRARPRQPARARPRGHGSAPIAGAPRRS